jgi:hypothetical protein
MDNFGWFAFTCPGNSESNGLRCQIEMHAVNTPIYCGNSNTPFLRCGKTAFAAVLDGGEGIKLTLDDY